MLYAFIDESERDELFYFLGAIVVDQDQLVHLEKTLNLLMFELSLEFDHVSPNEEFHGSSIMRAAEEPWRSIPFKRRTNLYRRALLAIRDSGAGGYIEGIDREKHAKKDYKHLFDPRELAFSYILERVNDVSSIRNPKVKVIADEHHTAEQSRTNFSNYQVTGTFGYRSSTLANIESSIEFKDSKLHRGLQAADLITYLFNRVKTVNENTEKGAKLKSDLWLLVLPILSVPRGKFRVWP